MKRMLKTFRAINTFDEIPVAERHIHSPRIRDFARNIVDFTDSETTHYEVCRPCRLKVIGAIIREAEAERTNTMMAA